MNKAMLVTLSLVVSTLQVSAQGVNPLAPSSENPKPARPESPPAQILGQPKSPRSPAGDKPINPDQPNLTIKAIILVSSREAIQEAGVPSAAGLQVKDIPFLSQPDFEKVAAPFLGQLLTENRIRDLEDAIILFCRDRGKLLVDVILPEQNIENGVLQLWVLEGKVGKLAVKNEGRKWFSDQTILDDVRLRPGDPVDAKKLTQDLNWLNNNPFRQVDVVFKPGEKLGLTDVELDVQDRLPVRPYFGCENTGTRFTGENRLLTGFNWGNAFGLDQQLNYQYMTDFNCDLVQAHSASYIVPLPWRHNLMLYGCYVNGKADFSSIGLNGTSAEGTSWQISGRYSIPLPDIRQYRHELSAGFDFKRSNNNLEAGGTNVLQKSDTDVAQFMLGYSGVAPDHYGRTAFNLEFYYSPGDLTGDNHDSDFNLLRTGAKANYFYARANAERITRLPGDFSWVLRGWAQIASERLLPSEELALGGYNTVRGYDERVVTGDNGWIINNELRTPPFVLGNLFQLPNGKDEIQFLAFFDYGAIRLIDVVPEDGTNPNKTLCSAGGGLRWTVSRNFSFRFDYGFPLTEKNINEHQSRGHIGALLSF